MKTLIIAILSVSLLSFTGCCATKKQTKSDTQVVAKDYNAIWSESAATYIEFCRQVAQGHVNAEKKARVDNAWGEFFLIYKASYAKSHGSGAPPTFLSNSASNLALAVK